jgi:tetratricopeptide (TPR) repeat protein
MVRNNAAVPRGARDARCDRGIAWIGRGRYRDAINSLEQVVKEDPSCADAWMSLAYCYDRIGRTLEAVSAIEEAGAPQGKNDADVLFILGRALYHMGRLPEALGSLDWVVEKVPGHAEGWYTRGNCHYHLGNFDEAIVSYKRAIEANPRFVKAWYNKGNSYADIGRFDDAVRCYNNCISINPGYAPIWNCRGVALAFLERFEDAVESFNESITINPRNPTVWNNKGHTLRRLGRVKEAEECFERVRSLPKKPELVPIL